MRAPGCLLLAVVLTLGAASIAGAHPAPFSYVDLRLQRDTIDASLTVHIFDAGHDLNVEPPERLLEPGFVSARAGEVIALLTPRLHLVADGRALDGRWSTVEALPDRQSIRLHGRYALTAPVGRLSLSTVMFPYDPNHQTFVNVYDGEALTQAILDYSHADLEYFAGTAQGTWAVLKRFIPLGVTHIVIGPDHLLFLLGLLLLGGTLAQLALVVTAFTVAHTVTLSLAALNIVSPPMRLIEPAIALSIVYVGADNLLVSAPRGGRDVRAWIALTFGFIHGLGFAAVLREMNLPARALHWALVGFNVGVEAGQLLVVLVVASALAAVRARSEAAGRQLVVAGSVLVIAAGAYWFVRGVF